MIELNNNQECPNFKIAKPFVQKTIELFESDFAMKVLSTEQIVLETSTNVNNINFISNLTGQIDASLIFSFDKQVAKKLLDSFPYLEYTPDMEDEMIVETVAEFLNIVIGNAMKHLEPVPTLRFSPPIGMTGDTKVYYGKDMQVCKIKLSLEDGEMLIIFCTKNKG